MFKRAAPTQAEKPLIYRYEKKFLIEETQLPAIMDALRLHPAMFCELYPPRYVNNIYLDSPLLTDYYSNLNGYASRGKVRVRWYHQLLRVVDDAVLEFKIKEGEVGRKEQFSFPPFTAGRGLAEAEFRRVIRDSDLPEAVRFRLRDLEFAIMNRYKRWYFATPDERYRLTVDADLSFCKLTKFENLFTHFNHAHGIHILELKYNTNDDPEAHRITSGLPFRVTRSSKYIAGIDQVYL
jgi:hypothetical protein